MKLTIVPFLLATISRIEARATGRNAIVVERASVSDATYDYIIVGGGLAGLTIADRLTENPKCESNQIVEDKTSLMQRPVKVLVVEAGPFDQGEDSVLVPGDYNPGPYIWVDTISAPIAGLLKQAFFVIMGKVVGGGSTVNAMFLHRPAAEEMTSWENLGATGWGYNDLLPYWKKVSKGDSRLKSWFC